jgi:hypothetical protein
MRWVGCPRAHQGEEGGRGRGSFYMAQSGLDRGDLRRCKDGGEASDASSKVGEISVRQCFFTRTGGSGLRWPKNCCMARR